MRYAWPGNVRELRNVVERMMIMHPTAVKFDRRHLPPLVHRESRRKDASEFTTLQPSARPRMSMTTF